MQARAAHCEPFLPVGGLIPALLWGHWAPWSLHTLLYCKGLLRTSRKYIACKGHSQEGLVWQEVPHTTAVLQYIATWLANSEKHKA